MTCAATDWLRTAKPRQEPGPGPTNLLEGGINKQLKDLAGNHRGMFDEHQRITMDWWLYVHTEDPVAPLELAKQQDFGRQGEKAARTAWAKEQLKRRGHPDGRPGARPPKSRHHQW